MCQPKRKLIPAPSSPSQQEVIYRQSSRNNGTTRIGLFAPRCAIVLTVLASSLMSSLQLESSWNTMLLALTQLQEWFTLKLCFSFSCYWHYYGGVAVILVMRRRPWEKRQPQHTMSSSSSYTLLNRSSASSSSSTNLLQLPFQRQHGQSHQFSIISQQGLITNRRTLLSNLDECFCPLELIGDLSLGDVGDLFRHAILGGGCQQQQSSSSSSLQPATQRVFEFMQHAVDSSRGGGEQSKQPATAKDDSIISSSLASSDPLLLAAAVRIFAEWRLIRLVPTSRRCSSSYSMGMSMSRRDLIRNMAKVETAVHEYRESSSMSCYPTLEDLLHHEISQGKHPRLPRLRDQSAANGLLWIVRQLNFQAVLLRHVANIVNSSNYPNSTLPHGDGDDKDNIVTSSKDAAMAAYREVYEDYHGFWVKKLFTNSFQASPTAHVIVNHMSAPLRYRHTTTRTTTYNNNNTVQEQQDPDDPESEQDPSASKAPSQQQSPSPMKPASNSMDMCSTPASSDTQQLNHLEPPSAPQKLKIKQEHVDFNYNAADDDDDEDKDNNFVQHFAHHVSDEWGKFQRLVTQCHGCGHQHQHHHTTAFSKVASLPKLATLASTTTMSAEGDDNSDPRSLDAIFDIEAFLGVMNPLIHQFQDLIHANNLNDPSRV